MNYQRRDWMSDDQFEAYKLLADLAGGDHHLAKVKEFGAGVETNIRCDLATFDFNQLTRIVFMAHDRCIRVAVQPSGPGMIKLCAFKRHKREGQMWERHPTLDEAVKEYRKKNPKPIH